jgi:hypothetical protein
VVSAGKQGLVDEDLVALVEGVEEDVVIVATEMDASGGVHVRVATVEGMT